MNRLELFCKFQVYSDFGTFFCGSGGASLQIPPKKKELETSTGCSNLFFFLAQNLINAMGERPKASAR